MPPAARVKDLTDHPGTISGSGVLSVCIGGAPAAVVDTPHICALPPNAGPHPQTTIVSGSTTVLIGGRAAARMGDKAACGAIITQGIRSVLIGG